VIACRTASGLPSVTVTGRIGDRKPSLFQGTAGIEDGAMFRLLGDDVTAQLFVGACQCLFDGRLSDSVAPLGEKISRLGPDQRGDLVTGLCPPPPLPPTQACCGWRDRRTGRSIRHHGFQHVAIDGRSSLMIHVDGSLHPMSFLRLLRWRRPRLSYFMSCAADLLLQLVHSRSSSRTLSAR